MAKKSTENQGSSTRDKGKAGSSKAAKTPKEKKARFARTKEIFQAYKMLKPNDPMLGMWIGLAAFAGLVIGFLLPVLFAGFDTLGIIFGVILGLLLAVLFGMLIFGFRARRTTFAQAEGRPGAAAWAMEQMRGDWRIKQGVSASMQQDIVHRVVGRPGVILVGEGTSGRLAGLIAQEKKKAARVIGETPIYVFLVGDGDDRVPLKKLNNTIMKLPRNITGAQIRAVEKRLLAVGTSEPPLPKGPMPGGRQMAISNRQMRRKGLSNQ